MHLRWTVAGRGRRARVARVAARTQTAAAYALLDVDGALLRVLELMSVRAEQSAIVFAILSASVAALIASGRDLRDARVRPAGLRPRAAVPRDD
jgi:hypothetical protein